MKIKRRAASNSRNCLGQRAIVVSSETLPTLRHEDAFVQMVKIRIARQEDRSKSLVDLARRGRIICLRDDEFVVPEPALELLATLNVDYDEMGRGGFDYAEKMLRDSLAAKTQ